MVSSVAIGATVVVVGLTISGGGGWVGVVVAVAVVVVVGRWLVGAVVAFEVVGMVPEVESSAPTEVEVPPSNAELDPQPANTIVRVDQTNTVRTFMVD
jgi:hypothetical protein